MSGGTLVPILNGEHFTLEMIHGPLRTFVRFSVVLAQRGALIAVEDIHQRTLIWNI